MIASDGAAGATNKVISAMIPPASASLENFFKSSFFLLLIALQFVPMNKLGNYDFVVKSVL